MNCRFAAVALGLALVPVAASAQTAAASAEQNAPVAEQVEASRAAVSETDFDRLNNDEAYARETLSHLDRLDSATSGDISVRLAFDSIRLIALHALHRPDDMRSIVNRMLEQRPREAETYYGPFIASLQLEDKALAIRVWEVASESVPGVGRTALRQLVDPEIIRMLFAELGDDEVLRPRFAQALFRIGWPGDGDQIGTDSIRLILVEDRLDHGDPEGARSYAATISTPETLRRLLVQRRYDDIVAPGQERAEVLGRALAERDRETADWVRVAPDNQRAVFDRVQLLRLLGRDEEAWTLLEPFTLDVRQTVQAGTYGMWLINVAADALVELHRDEEAVRLIHKLSELPVADNLDLIGPDINFAELLLRIGRPQEALQHATWLDTQQRQHANAYGQMWIDAALVCALAHLDRRIEAVQRLARMRAQENSQAALIRAHLCLGDEDAAAALLVQELEARGAGNTLLQLQDYTIAADRSDEMFDRLRALRDRSEVRAAVERVGRIFPMSTTTATLY